MAPFRGRDLGSAISFRFFRLLSGLLCEVFSVQAVWPIGMFFVRYVGFRSVVVCLVRYVGCDETISGYEVAWCASFHFQGVLIPGYGDVVCSFQRVKVYDQFAVSNGYRCVKDEAVYLRVF